MNQSEIVGFMHRHNMDQIMFADMLGVTRQAVNFWVKGEREMPTTTVRVLRIFDKYPQLMLEFAS